MLIGGGENWVAVLVKKVSKSDKRDKDYIYYNNSVDKKEHLNRKVLWLKSMIFPIL